MRGSYDNLLYQNKDVKVEFEYISNFNKEYLTFMLSINTKMFSGRQEFYLNIDYIYELIMQINKMDEQKNGKVVLSDSESESDMILLMNGYENVHLQGQIGNISDCISMKFDIIVDQTIIELLRKILIESINICNFEIKL